MKGYGSERRVWYCVPCILGEDDMARQGGTEDGTAIFLAVD